MVMPPDRHEAIATARRLKRTLASAPDPRRQAGAIHSALAAGEGWSPQERQAIDELGAWLNGRQSVDALSVKCDDVLGRLAKRHHPLPGR